MWKPLSDGSLQSVFNIVLPRRQRNAEYSAKEDTTRGMAGREQEEAERRLHKVELRLFWMRRIAMLGWFVMIVFKGHPFGFNFTWMTYLACLVYCTLLHTCLRKGSYPLLFSWVSTLGDSILTFLMCLTLGKSSSEFFPFFYFTLLGTVIRFGWQKSVVTLLVNAALVVILLALDTANARDWYKISFILLFLGYTFGFGIMLSGWAMSNLRRALMHAQQFEKERDLSQILLHRLINAQEEERKRLAGDLHDRTGEVFYSINRGLDECICMVTDDKVGKRLELLRSEVLACTAYIRTFMNELRPTVLDELGICEAISEYALAIKDMVPFAITTSLDPSLRDWRSREDSMLFRLMQEAVLNARKHSNAKSVGISLRKQGDGVVLSIEDDGCGFDISDTPVGHFGLLTMRERAQVAGGVMRIESICGRGTKVSVRFDNHG